MVLHLLHSLEPGGTERVVCRLAAALDGRGARHVLCGLRSPRPFGGEMAAGREQHCLNLAERDRFGFLKLASLLRRLRPAVVHARNWGTWSDAALACRLVGVPLILGFHGLQKGTDFTAKQKRRAAWLRLAAGEFTTVSERSAALLRAGLDVAPAHITIIPNGVDLDEFRPASPTERRAARSELGLPNSVKVIGCVANFFETIKGHDVLIESFARLAAQRTHVDLLLVGYGPLETGIRADVARRGLSDRVHFTGRREDVARVLAAFDLFVCPSHAEGMSNAVLESLAAGVPGIVTDVSDHRRLFAAIGADCVVPAGDAAALAHQLMALMDDAPWRQAVAGAARRVAEDFSFTRTVEMYRQVYAGVINRNRPARVSANASRGLASLVR